MKFYLHTTPSGIELVEGDKMPDGNDYCENFLDGSGEGRIDHAGYEAALQAAKASGIPVKDQEMAVSLIAHGQTILDIEKAKAHYCKPGEVYGPFDISYRVDEVFSHCTVGEKHYMKVAILLPESKLPEKEQRETFNMLFCQYFDLIKAGHSEHTTVTELMEHFTITRKQ